MAGQKKPVGPQQTLESLSSLSYRSGELQEYVDGVCKSVIALMGDGLAAITLYRNGKKNVLALMPENEKGETQFETHGQLSTYVVDSKCTLIVEDALADPQYGNAPEGYHSYLGAPLKMPNGDVVGTLCYFDRNKRYFEESEKQAAELFADRIAIALDNYELYQKLKDHSETLEHLVEHRTSELLVARDELARREKLAAVGEFASLITHEIRNPLATIRLALEYIEKQCTTNQALESKSREGLKKRAELAAGESSRLEQLLDEVLLYAKPTEIQPTPVELAEFINDFILTYESMAQEQDKKFVVEHNNGAIKIMADHNKLTQICVNLAKNSCDAANAGEDIRWKTGTKKHFAYISVHNKGSTIPKSKLHQITEAFVSAKPGGFGLGLAIVKSIVDAHRGELHIESSDKKGTTVSVYLPLV